MKTAGLLFLLILIFAGVGAIWLMTAPIAPHTETVTESIPDARIPR